MKKFLFVAVSGLHEIQRWITADTEKDARKKFWASLTDGEQSATESIECIDEEAA